MVPLPTTLDKSVGTSFHGNSCNDPNEEGGGQQPQGFDQWMAFYEKYRVHGSKCMCTFYALNAQDTSVVPKRAFVYPSNTPGWTDNIQMQSRSIRSYNRWKHIGSQNGLRSLAAVKNYMSTKRMYGLKSIAQEDNFTGTATTDPVDKWYWAIGMNTVNDSNFGVTEVHTVVVDIIYYVEFCKLKSVSIS